jgi:hypothetical protein
MQYELIDAKWPILATFKTFINVSAMILSYYEGEFITRTQIICTQKCGL